MKLKTTELQGAVLDWAVAKCEGLEVYFEDGTVCLVGQPFDTYWLYWIPTTDWAQSGPIIERERISTQTTENYWDADLTTESGAFIQSVGDTPLVAAMRAYVASQLGGEVELPEELIEVKLCS
jgi:hypothetical protein